MIELFLVRIRLSIGLADAFCDDFGKTLLMAGIFAVLTLHARRIFQEISTQGTSHNAVKLLGDELMPILLLYFLLTLS